MATKATRSRKAHPSPEEVLAEQIRTIGPTPTDSTLRFWEIGKLLCQARDNGPAVSPAKLACDTGYSKRELKYCVDVNRAFDHDRLERLVEGGMRWSTVRELAAKVLGPHREALIARFEEGELSNVELLHEAIAVRGGGRNATRADRDVGVHERALRRSVQSVKAQAARLRTEMGRAQKALDDLGAEGQDHSRTHPNGETCRRLREMADRLAVLREAAVALVRQAGESSGREG